MGMHTAVVSSVSSFVLRAWNEIGGWKTVGPLVGIFIGSFLARSWQRAQWVLESKKSEWRELISTLSQSVHCILKNMPSGVIAAVAPEVLRENLDAEVAGQKVIADRIFIDRQLRAEQIRERWGLIAAEHDYNRVCTYWNDLHDVLIKMARKDLGIQD